MMRLHPNKAWAIQGNPGLNLYMQASPGDGDCFFWSIGITRSDVVKLLNHHLFSDETPELQKRHYQEMLAEAIYREAFKPLDGLPNDMIDNEILNVLHTYHDLQEESDNLTRMALDILNLQNNPNDLQLLLNGLYDSNHDLAGFAADELIKIPGRFETVENAVRTWCQKHAQIRAFINTVIDSEEHIDVHWNLAEILGEIQNFNVVIYEIGDDGNSLKVTAGTEIINGNLLTKHIFYNGRNHFDVLLTNPQAILLPLRYMEGDCFILAGKVEDNTNENDFFTIGGKVDGDIAIPDHIYRTINDSLLELRRSIFDDTKISKKIFEWERTKSFQIEEISDELENQMGDFNQIPYGQPYEGGRFMNESLHRVLLEEGGNVYSSKKNMLKKFPNEIERMYNLDPRLAPGIKKMKTFKEKKKKMMESVDLKVTSLVIMDHLMSICINQKDGLMKPHHIPGIVEFFGYEEVPLVKISTKISKEQRIEAIRRIEDFLMQKQIEDNIYFVVKENGTVQIMASELRD